LETNIPCIGDDSGLIVPVINNEPGLYSARYAGVDATDSNNRNKLISKLKDGKLESTYAYFFCCIVAVGIKSQNEIIVCTGKVEGEVRTIERGKKGFGYDPMFYPKGYSESFAELNSLEKNKISHRGVALKKLMKELNKT
jgi:XTP/dITP diphosphohydrolase